jgi:uncharacterized membrane protein YfcA
MSLPLLALLSAVMVGTAFLSGIFGMAGGLILMGVLLALLPVPAAMTLHAVTQMASNGWRAVLWYRYVTWRPVLVYAVGCGLALGAWTLVQFVPSKPLALLFLGVAPFATRLLPASYKPDPMSALQGGLYGFACMSLMLMAGVAGPLLDQFFLGGGMERRTIVATKAVCQVLGHGLKLVYFGGLIANAASVEPLVAGVAIAASMLGTTLARRVLEAMSDAQYRRWADRIITAIAAYYIAHAGYLLATT